MLLTSEGDGSPGRERESDIGEGKGVEGGEATEGEIMLIPSSQRRKMEENFAGGGGGCDESTEGTVSSLSSMFEEDILAGGIWEKTVPLLTLLQE